MKWIGLPSFTCNSFSIFIREESHGYKQELCQWIWNRNQVPTPHAWKTFGRWFVLTLSCQYWVCGIDLSLSQVSSTILWIFTSLRLEFQVWLIVSWIWHLPRADQHLQKWSTISNQKLTILNWYLETSHLFLRCFFLTISTKGYIRKHKLALTYREC